MNELIHKKNIKLFLNFLTFYQIQNIIIDKT